MTGCEVSLNRQVRPSPFVPEDGVPELRAVATHRGPRPRRPVVTTSPVRVTVEPMPIAANRADGSDQDAVPACRRPGPA